MGLYQYQWWSYYGEVLLLTGQPCPFFTGSSKLANKYLYGIQLSFTQCKNYNAWTIITTLETSGVGPLDDRPSPAKLHHFVQKKKKKKKCDMWHMTCDRWQVTRDTWHMTRDMFGEVSIPSKFQLPSSYCLWFMILWRSGGKGWLNELIN